LAHFCQLAEGDIVQRCKEPVEVWGLGVLREVLTSPQIITVKLGPNIQRPAKPKHKFAQATSAVSIFQAAKQTELT